MTFSPVDLIASFLFTWVLGLAPAFVARRMHKGPVTRRRANLIAGVTCFVLALLGLVLKSAAGEPNPRISPAWIFVFLVARWIMIRGDKKPIARDEMAARLRAMVTDPSTSDEHRQRAQVSLDKLEQRLSSESARKSPSRVGTSAGWPRLSPRTYKLAIRVFAIAVVANVLLMVSGHRLLLRERAVQPGDNYSAGDYWGDLGTYERPTIACWYWTGRSLIPEAFLYGSEKSERDECALLHKHMPGE